MSNNLYAGAYFSTNYGFSPASRRVGSSIDSAVSEIELVQDVGIDSSIHRTSDDYLFEDAKRLNYLSKDSSIEEFTIGIKEQMIRNGDFKIYDDDGSVFMSFKSLKTMELKIDFSYLNNK
jgi:hypothetical protein